MEIMTTKEPVDGVDLQRLVVALRWRIAHCVALLLFLTVMAWVMFQAIANADRNLEMVMRGGCIVWICMTIDRWLERKGSGHNH